MHRQTRHDYGWHVEVVHRNRQDLRGARSIPRAARLACTKGTGPPRGSSVDTVSAVAVSQQAVDSPIHSDGLLIPLDPTKEPTPYAPPTRDNEPTRSSTPPIPSSVEPGSTSLPIPCPSSQPEGDAGVSRSSPPVPDDMAENTLSTETRSNTEAVGGPSSELGLRFNHGAYLSRRSCLLLMVY